MIPPFPTFKKLEISDKEKISAFVEKFPPSSEHSFSSLYCWDSLGVVELSNLNNNLIVLLTDFLSNERFLTFIGNKRIGETIDELFLQLKEKQELPFELRLILGDCLAGFNSQNFKIIEDRDHFDYIYSLEDLANLVGNKFRGKRNFVNRFNRLYTFSVKELDLSDGKTWKEVQDLFHLWASRHSSEEGDVDNESVAIGRFKNIASQIETCNLGIYHKERLIGYTLNEINDNDYITNHFEHADTDFVGIFPKLKNQTAKNFKAKGFKYLSHQEDLGLEKLRKSKTDWLPAFYLKKYTILPAS